MLNLFKWIMSKVFKINVEGYRDIDLLLSANDSFTEFRRAFLGGATILLLKGSWVLTVLAYSAIAAHVANVVTRKLKENIVNHKDIYGLALKVERAETIFWGVSILSAVFIHIGVLGFASLFYMLVSPLTAAVYSYKRECDGRILHKEAKSYTKLRNESTFVASSIALIGIAIHGAIVFIFKNFTDINTIYNCILFVFGIFIVIDLKISMVEFRIMKNYRGIKEEA